MRINHLRDATAYIYNGLFAAGHIYTIDIGAAAPTGSIYHGYQHAPLVAIATHGAQKRPQKHDCPNSCPEP